MKMGELLDRLDKLEREVDDIGDSLEELKTDFAHLASITMQRLKDIEEQLKDHKAETEDTAHKI